MFLAACASATVEDAVPQAALESDETAGRAEAPDAAVTDANAMIADAPGPRDTGRYPNLNIPPGVAAEQISDAQRAETIGALRQARSRQGEASDGRPASEDEADRLRGLGRTHGAEALKAIEADEEEEGDDG